MSQEIFTLEFDSRRSFYTVICRGLVKKLKLDTLYLDGYKYISKTDRSPKIELLFNIHFDTPVNLEYNGEKLTLVRLKNDKIVGTEFSAEIFESLIIQSTSKEKLLNLINEIISEEENGDKNIDNDNINIYVYDKCYWSLVTSQRKRSYDTIILDEKLKQEIITDVKSFLNDRNIYETVGIPYKRSYLLYGPPGTGKTSMIYSIASELNYNIGIFKITTEKETLESAYKTIPKNTIMLIEDIEHCFPSETSEKRKFEINDLMNVLDGVLIKDQLITFLTTNKVDGIPKVLLRPGRVDEIYTFKYSTREQIINIHRKFCPNEDSLKFYESVKHLNLTPAILQKFLFRQSKKRKISELEEIINITNYKEQYKNNYI